MHWLKQKNIGADDTLTVDAQHKPQSWLTKQIQIHAYIPETITLAGLLAILNMGFFPSQPGFIGVEPNPFWAVVLLITARYGFRAGIFSSIVSAFTYLGLVGSRAMDQIVNIRDLMSWHYAKPAVLFITVGTVIGMLVQRHKDRAMRLAEENELLIKDNLQLKQGEEELRDVNVELANRVIGATDTLPMLYKYAKKLNNLDTDEIYTVLTELVLEVIKSTQVSIYLVHGNQLPLHSRNGKPLPGPELTLEPGLYESLVVKREILTLHDLLSRNIKRKDLFLCGPLSPGTSGKVQAILVVEELEFLRYNPATVRLFQVIVDWACASLEKAASFAESPEELRLAKAKADVMRVKRATLLHGEIPREAMVSGVVDSEGTSSSETIVPKEPERPAQMPSVPDLAKIMPLSSNPNLKTPSVNSGLSQLLEQANASLFSAEPPKAEEGKPPVSDAPQDRALLQHMLSGELQIASSQGNPLAKLLAEIDGYMMSGKGGNR